MLEIDNINAKLSLILYKKNISKRELKEVHLLFRELESVFYKVKTKLLGKISDPQKSHFTDLSTGWLICSYLRFWGAIDSFNEPNKEDISYLEIYKELKKVLLEIIVYNRVLILWTEKWLTQKILDENPDYIKASTFIKILETRILTQKNSPE